MCVFDFSMTFNLLNDRIDVNVFVLQSGKNVFTIEKFFKSHVLHNVIKKADSNNNKQEISLHGL